MLRLFPEYLKGEELFGLTVHAVLRIAESVRKGPGVGAGGRGEGWFCPRSAQAKVSMTCAHSCLEWKAVKIIYSAMDATPLMELPLMINPTGCARSEPKILTHYKR